MDTCEHIKSAKQDTTPTTLNGCEDCLKTGDTWVNLRLCLTCGHVGCCDSSKNKHATAHFEKTKHPVIKSLEVNDDWLYCYLDKIAT